MVVARPGITADTVRSGVERWRQSGARYNTLLLERATSFNLSFAFPIYMITFLFIRRVGRHLQSSGDRVQPTEAAFTRPVATPRKHSVPYGLGLTFL